MKLRSVPLLVAVVAVAVGCGSSNQGPQLSAEAKAGKSYVSSSCLGCHSTDGSKLRGPTFKNLYGAQVTLTTGAVVTADESYLKRALQQPDADIPKGYRSGVMSNAYPPGSISDERARQVIAYLQSLAQPQNMR